MLLPLLSTQKAFSFFHHHSGKGGYRYDFHEYDNDHLKGLTSAGVSASYGQKGISMELLLIKNGRMANIP